MRACVVAVVEVEVVDRLALDRRVSSNEKHERSRLWAKRAGWKLANANEVVVQTTTGDVLTERGKTLFRKFIQEKMIRVLPAATLMAMIGLMSVSGAALAEDAEGVSVERGKQLFELCTQCHATNGGGNSDVLAPAIAGLPAWYVEAQLKNFKNGVRGLHAGDTGGLRMYPMSLWLRTDADQKSIAEYVASMPVVATDRELETPGDAARGAGYYAVCSACHGQAAEGNAGMGAPPLAGQSDWYLYSSIDKYRKSIRGTGAGDPFGAAMIGMVATLPDDNAILDVIAHIQSLEK